MKEKKQQTIKPRVNLDGLMESTSRAGKSKHGADNV
jgi:hypothetical protein|tara:strand:+ start:48 stop:155 length:108 start_codon:yes stop_codon:yes gene_type:complete